MLSIEVYLASYTLGDFKISYFKMGPTELRVLLSVGNIAVYFKSMVHLAGRAYRLFDVAGTIGISGMFAILLISVIQNTAKLYRREPLPSAAPDPAFAGASVVPVRVFARVAGAAAVVSARFAVF